MDADDPRPRWRRRVTGAEVPPPRPARFTPHDLRFQPQPAVRWFSPGVLTASGLRVGVASVFGSFLDKRELQSARPASADLRFAHAEDLWIDYVADTGDGFEATATVASVVARRELRVEGVDAPLPRGRILVFGGDEVYPVASPEGYDDRLEGPWRAALPWTEPPSPTLYAIPGNHDWFDGLTGFMRLFGQGRWIGGWQTHQTRSYFAVQLPQRWWLWGVDIQSGALVDEPQLDFFARVAERAQEGDKLILATAIPSWTLLDRDPHAYRNLAYLERAVLRPAGIELKLTLAGDSHHYSRYQQLGAEDEIGPAHKITSGGGGAFLHPTHVLPREASIGVTPDDLDDVTGYAMVTTYPGRGRSRLLSLSAVGLALRNPSFCAIPGLVTLALLWTVQFGLRALERPEESFAEAAAHWGWTDLAGGLVRTASAALVVLVLYAALWGFAKTPRWAAQGWQRWAVKSAMAALHLALQLVAIVAVMVAALALASGRGSVAFVLVASAAALVLGGLAGATVVGLYLAAAIATPGIEAHPNEAFAAARITGYKNFLRLHIDGEGRLTVYAVGIPRAVKRRWWRAVPDAADVEASWIEPTRRPPEPHLIDTITLR